MDAATKKQKRADYFKAHRLKNLEAKKEANKLQMQKRRELTKANPEKHAEEKKADKERKKMCYERKKAENSNAASSQSSFKNPLERACRITFQLDLLPKDEAKRKEIVLGMAKRLGFNVQGPMPKSAKTLEVEKFVTDFYSSDKISRIPNSNAVVPIEKGGSETTSLRFMTCTIQEAYEKYKADFPQHKICFQNFSKLRPNRFVKLRSKTPRDTCVCSIHANMEFALKALARVNPTYKDLAIGNDMSKNFICDGDKEVCFSNKCFICKHSPAFFEKFQENEVNATKLVTWEQWQKAIAPVGISSQVQRVPKTGTVPDLIKHIKEMKVKFLLHVLVKRNQADALFDQEKEEEQEEDDDCDGILANNFHDYGPWSQFQHNCSIENK